MRFESTAEKNNQTARQDGETEILKETGMPEEPEKAEMPEETEIRKKVEMPKETEIRKKAEMPEETKRTENAELRKKSTVRDMTEGSIAGHLTAFALPLLFGNVFQMLYNTVDSIVVGNFVGKEALAAISSTTMIVNIMIFFFNGFSIGGGVVISQYFGARKLKELHRTVETVIAVTIPKYIWRSISEGRWVSFSIIWGAVS